MRESFYFSNMSPQVPSFNRGVWKKLEELVREWAVAYKKIYVATGPVLTKGLPTIGPNEVSVPSYFYKVILEQHDGETKAIGFIIPNESSSSSLQDYAVSIDHVEEITGIDFYCQLEDAQEKEVEKKLCIPCWNWKKN
ncbi:MAG: DNA/RNA non-specific endonuclease, partial [Ferruginibacter sp.]|nr:DNA/RNA non-specific endonuclease [Ferruginibacter sp.]